MTFLHVALLGGTLAVAVPIVLHMIMRKQPKHLEFPALRFLQQRQHANRRQVRLRHWLLLALRCAAIGLLAVALARPSILASGVLGDQEAPVAAALVFDTNPRMQYRQDNRTRLEVAQDTAGWLLGQLPAESEVAVVDSRSGTAAFAVDPAAARQRVERLDASLMSRPLATAIEAALELLEESGKPRKEVYVFTDLSRAAWSAEAMRGVAAKLQRQTALGVYLIDVGVADPADFALGPLRLSAQILPRNRPLALATELAHRGPGGDRAVEVALVDRDGGNPEIRGRQPVALPADGAQRIEFRLSGLEPGLHQGYVKIAGQDALACDDTQWFTVEVRPAWRVLVAAPHDADRAPADYGLFVSEALAPYALRARGEATFECTVIDTDALAGQPLDAFSAVFLLDPRPLPAESWQRLHTWVAAGGGLGIFLGRNAAPVESFNEPAAQELLPGKLVRQWRSEGDVYLAPDQFAHPLLAEFADLNVAWPLLPVFRHWQFGELASGANAVVRFSNNEAAIVERPVGKGRVIAMATPLSDPASRPGQRGYLPWNLIPTGDDQFPFYLLANTTAQFLVGSGSAQLNYPAGGAAVVPLAADQRKDIYVLTTPDGDQIRTPANELQDAVVVTGTERPGNYRVQSGGGEAQVDLGFSVNLPPSVSQLDRAAEDGLQAIFGDVPFRLARNRDEIDRSVSAGRVGQELFPYLIVLLVLVLAGEQVLSNRFYQDYDTRKKTSRAAQLARKTAEPDQGAPRPATVTK